jgi:hypothetical protein
MFYRGQRQTGRTEIAQALATPNCFLLVGIGSAESPVRQYCSNAGLGRFLRTKKVNFGGKGTAGTYLGGPVSESMCHLNKILSYTYIESRAFSTSGY